MVRIARTSHPFRSPRLAPGTFHPTRQHGRSSSLLRAAPEPVTRETFGGDSNFAARVLFVPRPEPPSGSTRSARPPHARRSAPASRRATRGCRRDSGHGVAHKHPRRRFGVVRGVAQVATLGPARSTRRDPDRAWGSEPGAQPRRHERFVTGSTPRPGHPDPWAIEQQISAVGIAAVTTTTDRPQSRRLARATRDPQMAAIVRRGGRRCSSTHGQTAPTSPPTAAPINLLSGRRRGGWTSVTVAPTPAFDLYGGTLRRACSTVLSCLLGPGRPAGAVG